MKTFLLIIMSMMTFTGYAFSNKNETTTFKVYGACGMCESRIEKAAKIDGVSSADWSVETKMLTITYNPEITELDDVHNSIAEAGHDTEKVKADNATYNSLHACCRYERKDK
jgi:copper chaperone CopZ